MDSGSYNGMAKSTLNGPTGVSYRYPAPIPTAIDFIMFLSEKDTVSFDA